MGAIISGSLKFEKLEIQVEKRLKFILNIEKRLKEIIKPLHENLPFRIKTRLSLQNSYYHIGNWHSSIKFS